MSTNIIGKVHSISCKDFVTYDQVSFFPGDYLNVIIGPNGTGKSTLVAALLLAMGGNPKLLSRSSSIQDYVKNGKELAVIEVKLYKTARRKKISFERQFDLRGKSTWKVDGVPVLQPAYLQAISDYNIQINNLCQFLPQDRVQDFTKMNPQQILENTQSSVCTTEMVESLEKLKELRNYQLNSKKILENQSKRRQEAEQRNNELKPVIDKMNLKNELLQKIDLCLKKKSWLEVESLKEQIEQVEQEMKQAEYQYNRDKKIYQTGRNKAKTVLNKIDEMKNQTSAESMKGKQLSGNLDQLSSVWEGHENAISKAQRYLQDKKSEQKEHANRLAHADTLLQAALQDLQNSISACGTEEDQKQQRCRFEDEINVKKQKVTELTNERGNLNFRLDDMQPELNRIKKQLYSAENVGERKLRMLQERFPDVHRAVAWLRQNQHQFEGRVYEPMLLELDVKDEKNAKYIENTVALRDLTAFTCTHKADMELLIRNLCNEQNLNVNVLHSAEANSCNYKAQHPIEELRNYGFYSYLLDMIKGPAPILNYLCEEYHIHNVLIGTDEVEMHSENLPPHINCFFTENVKFSILISRYSKEASSLRSAINNKNLLYKGADEKLINHLKKRLYEITRDSDKFKNRRGEIEAKINEAEEEVREILKRQRAYEEKQRQVTICRDQLKIKKRKVLEIRNSAIDLEAEESKFKQFVKERVIDIIDIEKRKLECIKKYQKSVEMYQYYSNKLYVYKQETVDIENQLKTAEDDLKNSERRLETITNNSRQCKENYKEKENAAKALCNGKSPNDRNFPLIHQFKNLPNDRSELDRQITEIQTDVDFICNENQGIFREYEDRQKEIEQLRYDIQDAENKSESLQSDITAIHDRWYPQITNVVEIINQNFSKFMSSMDYVGEVKLAFNELNDYESYGIQILVQYRNNARLQALDRFVQSGGERAVAIAIYSLSLQHMTTVPFRCVDEINQGMDPRNERKVFDMLVDETCRVGSSQYFFVTPKLLPNLNYNDLITFHVVFNGNLHSTNIFNCDSRRV